MTQIQVLNSSDHEEPLHFYCTYIDIKYILVCNKVYQTILSYSIGPKYIYLLLDEIIIFKRIVHMSYLPRLNVMLYLK